MHRFGLVLPFLDTPSTYRFLRSCRVAKAELGPKRELALVSQTTTLFEAWDQDDNLERTTFLDFTFFSSDEEVDALFRFLSSPKLKNLRRLQMPWFLDEPRLCDSLRLASGLTEIYVELGDSSVAQLCQLPRLTHLALGRTWRLDLTLLPPNVKSLDLDAITSQGCQGELSGLDSLTALRVDNWGKRVPLTVRHLEVRVQGVHGFLVETPSNIAEVAKTLVTLRCGFPWPGIKEWPRLERLAFEDHSDPLCWEIAQASALDTFECAGLSIFAENDQIRPRTLRVPAEQLHFAIQPPATVQHLCLTSFDPNTVSLSEFTGLRSLELSGDMFTESHARRINLTNLEEFTFVKTNKKECAVELQFLKCPNVQKLRIELRLGGWFSTPIPLLPKLESIECDFFHTTMFQPWVKHLKIATGKPTFSNKEILKALRDCKRLESLHVPLRPGLSDLILEKFPMLAVI